MRNFCYFLKRLCDNNPLLHGAGSQVCNLLWSKNVNEIVSSHGYSQNQIIVWKYPAMSKLATLTGHTLRVLYLAVSPDGQTIVTGAGAAPLPSQPSLRRSPRTCCPSSRHVYASHSCQAVVKGLYRGVAFSIPG